MHRAAKRLDNAAGQVISANMIARGAETGGSLMATYRVSESNKVTT
jgi:hypothetical protein